MVYEYSLPHIALIPSYIPSKMKHWFFLYFVNVDRHIFLKKRAWSERLRLKLR